ncbi:MAG: hypothetical protein PHG67_09855 [Bacteroidales bacterium]|nr:hypothetical protein [Bacteroidales bacterium]
MKRAEYSTELKLKHKLKSKLAMEKILKIEETSFNGKEGFVITTDQQEIKLGIDNGQCCCENWGYFMSEDDLSEFIGTNLISVKIVDTALKNWEEIEDMYEGNAMFVNIETSNGLLQFVAYNEHNGYYGHEACVISKQVKEECYL